VLHGEAGLEGIISRQQEGTPLGRIADFLTQLKMRTFFYLPAGENRETNPMRA
jgi:hypothetical protein